MPDEENIQFDYDQADWNDPYDGDIEDDEDEPCGNLYAPGSEECEFCKWSDQCYQDYVYWLKREERRRKVKRIKGELIKRVRQNPKNKEVTLYKND